MTSKFEHNQNHPDTLGVAGVAVPSDAAIVPVGANIEHDSSLNSDVASRLGAVDYRDDILTLAEETATFGVERKELGGVRVRVVTDEDNVTERVPTRSETVEVTRHPVNREVEAVPDIRTEGDLTIIPVVEERVITITRLVLTEEVHIRRTVQMIEQDVPVTLRRQRAVVERLDENGVVSAADAAANL